MYTVVVSKISQMKSTVVSNITIIMSCKLLLLWQTKQVHKKKTCPEITSNKVLGSNGH